MATNVHMPQLGLTMTEGRVVRWLKALGDPVAAGEGLLEIETDKITTQIEAPVEGILLQVLAEVGDTLPVQAVLAVIGEPGEKAEAVSEAVSNETSSDENRICISPAAKKLAKNMNVDYTLITGSGPGGRIVEHDIKDFASRGNQVKASPLAVKMAAEKGMNLADITKDSRIMKADVLAVLNNKPSELKETAAGLQVTPIAGMRKVIAERMSISWRTAPHVNMTVEVDMTTASELKERLVHATNSKYSFTEIIIKAAAQVLTEFKEVNRSLINDMVYQHETANVGVAVALDGGLIVPVVKDAQKKSLGVLHNEIALLSEKARKGSLSPDEIGGGTFTVTNLGMYGVDHFTPIINPPESAILGVCRVVKKAVVIDDALVIRPIMNLCLSFDHRLVDGAAAARFLQKLRQMLEEPYLLI